MTTLRNCLIGSAIDVREQIARPTPDRTDAFGQVGRDRQRDHPTLRAVLPFERGRHIENRIAPAVQVAHRDQPDLRCPHAGGVVQFDEQPEIVTVPVGRRDESSPLVVREDVAVDLRAGADRHDRQPIAPGRGVVDPRCPVWRHDSVPP